MTPLYQLQPALPACEVFPYERQQPLYVVSFKRGCVLGVWLLLVGVCAFGQANGKFIDVGHGMAALLISLKGETGVLRIVPLLSLETRAASFQPTEIVQ